MVLALFSDSLGLFTSIALGFVPKDTNWSGNGPKQKFQKTLKTCLTSAQTTSWLVPKSSLQAFFVDALPLFQLFGNWEEFENHGNPVNYLIIVYEMFGWPKA